MSLSQQTLEIVNAILPGNTSLTHFTSFSCSHADLEALIRGAYQYGWNDREGDLILGVERLGARQEGARGGEPVALREADVAYLVRLVERDLPRSHVGEGTLDRRDREAAEQRAAAIKLALYASPAEPSGWKPIESAPKDGTAILIWSKYGVGVAARHWDAAFTHWMPLPLPPTSEGGGA